ncbi:hypothetical protein BD289DRAFT_110667 [Coniella lustricola]|uniref:Uncharacterized protein n=1 Tax=Coniella lustricola TaxID=2025994 RepID=A0A2T2ZXA5_9PEZI|nr:hypothetical protein BD289DRAFT_110667 [Coniella lustricola]
MGNGDKNQRDVIHDPGPLPWAWCPSAHAKPTSAGTAAWVAWTGLKEPITGAIGGLVRPAQLGRQGCASAARDALDVCESPRAQPNNPNPSSHFPPPKNLISLHQNLTIATLTTLTHHHPQNTKNGSRRGSR